jgi:sugar phosphate isomerase/epimerase
MYLSLNGVPIGGKLPWPDFARLASTTGFKGVDVNLDAARADGVDKTRALLEGLHLRPSFVNLPVAYSKDDGTYRSSLAKLEDAAPFAAAIGCPRMMTAIGSSSATPKDELRRLYLKRFRECADIMARSHCRLGLEFLGPLHFRRQFPHEFIWSMPEMVAFAKDCGSNVGVTLDAWHWHHSGGTLDDILKAGKERIVAVHFDDAADQPPDQVRDNQRLLPGKGVINLVGFLQALQKIGYRDSLSVEVFDSKLKELPPEESARLCLESSREVFQKAGIKES